MIPETSSSVSTKETPPTPTRFLIRDRMKGTNSYSDTLDSLPFRVLVRDRLKGTSYVYAFSEDLSKRSERVEERPIEKSKGVEEIQDIEKLEPILPFIDPNENGGWDTREMVCQELREGAKHNVICSQKFLEYDDGSNKNPQVVSETLSSVSRKTSSVPETPPPTRFLIRDRMKGTSSYSDTLDSLPFRVLVRDRLKGTSYVYAFSEDLDKRSERIEERPIEKSKGIWEIQDIEKLEPILPFIDPNENGGRDTRGMVCQGLRKGAKHDVICSQKFLEYDGSSGDPRIGMEKTPPVSENQSTVPENTPPIPENTETLEVEVPRHRFLEIPPY
ncbi:hypothetical protein [Pasteuria penetrans]|uniref:hypothetical protein n=1 Tax=Pasteuria penetrans TaxID=86005 RepID=UPI0011EF4643|nr:hypothetical protein [Pasteuria penetrans]